MLDLNDTSYSKPKEGIFFIEVSDYLTYENYKTVQSPLEEADVVIMPYYLAHNAYPF